MKRGKCVVVQGPKLKLSTTKMCIQCETLYSCMEKCPVCGSTGMPLTHWVPSSESRPMVRRVPSPQGVA